MSAKPQQEEETKEFAPLWITTFADLIGQLFSFFVMLLVLGSMQESGMLGATRDAFTATIKSFGMPGLLYGHDKKNMSARKIKYSVSNPEETEERTLDATEGELQKLYGQVTGSVETMESQVSGAKTTYMAKDVRFANGRSELSDADRELVGREMSQLKAELTERDVKIYIVGLAPKERTERMQWVTSAKRAEAVAAYMRKRLPDSMGWQVYSWGAGAGGEWAGSQGQMAKEANIMMAVLRQK